MELTALLDALDRTTANLDKLEAVWTRAESFMPTGPAAGSDPEYDDLRRSWMDLLPGLPKIDDWTITEELPDIDELGRALFDWSEIGEPAWMVYAACEQPGKDLAEYRYRLNRARRRAGRERLGQLSALLDSSLPVLLTEIPRDSADVLSGDLPDQLRGAISEIERLMGGTARQSNRWPDPHRHLVFSEGTTGTTSKRRIGPASSRTSRLPAGLTPIPSQFQTSPRRGRRRTAHRHGDQRAAVGQTRRHQFRTAAVRPSPRSTEPSERPMVAANSGGRPRARPVM